MKYLGLSKAGLCAFFLLLFAAPAFAQFEVSPDHFDEQPPAKAKAAARKKVDARLASSHQRAGARVGAAKQQKVANASLAGKPHPGTKLAGTLAAAKKRSSATRRPASSSASVASSLKAQASNVRRE